MDSPRRSAQCGSVPLARTAPLARSTKTARAWPGDPDGQPNDPGHRSDMRNRQAVVEGGVAAGQTAVPGGRDHARATAVVKEDGGKPGFAVWAPQGPLPEVARRKLAGHRRAAGQEDRSVTRC